MYITADGAEVVHEGKYTDIFAKQQATEQVRGTENGAVAGLRVANGATHTGVGTELKTESVDVKKVGEIYTSDTPDGRVKLFDYFNKVEKMLATEIANRKVDIAKIRTQMAKNRAINEKARGKMKKMLLARMAVNAKAAKDALDEQMRITAKKFAAAAALENKRQKAVFRRAKKTREIMKKNKKEGAKALKLAVTNQQRALSALDAATNKKLAATSKAIAGNAAQIKENAIKARKELDHAMNNFDKKMSGMTEEAQKGRSKLAADAKAMDKKVRAMISGKIRKQTAEATANFQDARSQMAKDRQHADMMLAQASTRLTSALTAEKTTQDARFKEITSDIAATKKEASDKVEAFRNSFKVQILSLDSTVKEQVTKMNSRVNTLQGTVASNKAEQAKVNNEVNDEIKKMIKIGNEREADIAKSDAALASLMKANAKDTQEKMSKMADNFYAELGKIRAQMKKDRAHNEQRLQKQTGALFETLKKNKDAQDAINDSLDKATKAAADESARQLKAAKHDFSTRLSALTQTVNDNDKKAEGKILALTGTVRANAEKDAKGRAELKSISEANKKEMKNIINQAIEKGEKRAKQIEKMAKDMNKKTRDALNGRISTEIGELTKTIHGDIEGLQLETAEARASMKKEILLSLREEAVLLKEQLADAVKWANGEFVKLEEGLATEVKTSNEGNAALKGDIDANKATAVRAIRDAAAAQARALLALEVESQHKIKKTNTAVGAYGDAIVAHAKKVSETMTANIATLEGKLEEARAATEKALKGADAASAARHKKALDEVTEGLKAAEADADAKFSKAYTKMGENRAHAAEALGAAVTNLNDKIAKAAALEDSRFADTVKDIGTMKAEAREEIAAARKDLNMDIVSVRAFLTEVDTRLIGDIQIVAKMVVDDTAEQARINKHVDAEIKRVISLSDKNYSEDKRARGKIKEIMDKHKEIAQKEVADLAAKSAASVAEIEDYQNGLVKQWKNDLSDSTTRLYEKMAEDRISQDAAVAGLKTQQGLAIAKTDAALVEAKEDFKAMYEGLVDTVSAHHKDFEDKVKHQTGVVYDWKATADADRALLRKEANAMKSDLSSSIVKAIQIGEAKAAEVLEVGIANIEAHKAAMMIEIGEQIEAMADEVLKTIVEDRKTTANNYLSVKAYSKCAQDQILDYINKGEGNGLSSVGGFLKAVAIGSEAPTKPSQGIAAGSGGFTAPFGGGVIAEVPEINKVNGLVDEYYLILTDVRSQYPYGIGNYLLTKLSKSMTAEGILTTGPMADHSGTFVYVSGKTLGLAHKMDDFSALGCRITDYEEAMGSLTAKLPHKAIVTPIVVPAPEWQGN